MDLQQDHPICTACGTLYDPPRDDNHCAICDDPRQFVPVSQTFTTLRQLRSPSPSSLPDDQRRRRHRNAFAADDRDPRITSISTTPKFGIGQRAILIETGRGNVLWDCIALVDRETVDYVNGRGGLAAIVISHPHFYTTNAVWAEAFGCPVYVAAEDEGWLFSRPEGGQLRRLIEVNTEILPGVTAIKCGGHFPGSLCLHWERKLFSSDTIMTVASGSNPAQHYTRGKTATYSFMWSIPNMIPLDPSSIQQILERLKPFDFTTTFGNIPGMDLRNGDLKRRVLESAQIQVKNMGWEGKHEGELILQQNWDEPEETQSSRSSVLAL